MSGLRLRPMFAWYDLWIGVFIDRQNRLVYNLPAAMPGREDRPAGWQRGNPPCHVT